MKQQVATRITPFPVRMPPELRAWLTVQAENADRSLNAEVVRTLTKAMKANKSVETNT